LELEPALEKEFAQRSRASSLTDSIAADLLRTIMTNSTGRPVTRATFRADRELAGARVSPSTVSRAARTLLRADLIRNGGELELDGPGRPEVELEINPDFYLLGIAVDDAPDHGLVTASDSEFGYAVRSRASQAFASVVRLNGQHEASSDVEIIEDPHDPQALANTVASLIERHKVPHGGSLRGVGLAVGGHVDEGVLKYSPNFGGLGPLNIVEMLRNRLIGSSTGVDLASDLEVALDNDANAIALWRAWYDPSLNGSNLAVILVKDDGIGGAFIVSGHVDAGHSGMAGEPGHLPVEPSDPRECRCGNRGCLERVGTLLAIAEELEISGASLEAVSIQVLAQIADGRPAAIHALQVIGTYLGRALATIIATRDPETVCVFVRPELRDSSVYTNAVIDGAKAHVLPSVRADLNKRVRFAALPDADERSAAATAILIERIVDRQSGR
jgi:predicted NBD/HSP70 family sugar kinase